MGYAEPAANQPVNTRRPALDAGATGSVNEYWPDVVLEKDVPICILMRKYTSLPICVYAAVVEPFGLDGLTLTPDQVHVYGVPAPNELMKSRT